MRRLGRVIFATGSALSLVLNGFSKMFSLPGHKVAWIRAGGRNAERFLRSIEYVSDTLLPVSELSQAIVRAVQGTPIHEAPAQGLLVQASAAHRSYWCSYS